LRGRAGRQGDVGETRFYVALDDSLMRIFGGDKVAKIMDMMKVDENTPIESKMVSSSIEGRKESGDPQLRDASECTRI
jgi:preprotein translocase subunit SecA